MKLKKTKFINNTIVYSIISFPLNILENIYIFIYKFQIKNQTNLWDKCMAVFIPEMKRSSQKEQFLFWKKK